MQRFLLPCIAVVLWSSPAVAAVSAIDARNVTVTLEKPAGRIVSLAPHVTELLFAAGAGAKIVGAMEYSDYPEEALRIPRIGGAGRVDLERMVQLGPDLVVAWQSGNAAGDIRRLEALGIPVFVTEPRRLEAIGEIIRQLGDLAGTEAQAKAAADAYRDELTALRKQYAGRPSITVYFQIWSQPLMTVNGEHVIDDIITLCGGRNVFADLRTLAPTISVEAVIAREPEAIIATATGHDPGQDLDIWRRWTQLPAVRHGNLFIVERDLVARHTPRILDGVQQICRLLDEARDASRPGQ